MGKRRAGRKCQNNYVDEESRKNELFQEYYTKQFDFTSEEWEKFYSALKSELPTTFRVTGFREHSKEVQWLLQNKFLDSLVEDNDSTDKHLSPKSIPWYPGKLAWQLNSSKMEIRRTPELKKLHRFLVSETECGYISRQEAVSMIPPLLLDIKSHHKVLDLCAAPGSKTAQLIEMLHSNCDGIPSGVIVANDIDNKRCYMMVHQLQRLQSPSVMVMRQDASIFPKIYVPDVNSKYGRTQMFFDRILVDVPCSGDGTLRKNPTIWPRWSPNLAVNEHFLQLKILRRSLEMLSVGGRIVYSTCSLSPSEDEAVIAATLKQCQGTVRLIDIGTLLPDLEAEPGLTNWGVMLKNKTWYYKFDDVPQEQRRSLRPTLFTPENVETLNLQYCRRVMPHVQNTGGFFLAVIEKVAHLPWINPTKCDNGSQDKISEVNNTNIQDVTTEKKEPNQPNDTEDLFQGPSKKKQRVYKEDPFIYVETEDADWLKIKDFFGISDKFPYQQLMYRNSQGVKRRFFYYTNEIIKGIVKANEDREGVNFVNMGVKLFGISEDKTFQGYRLLQDGIEISEPFVAKDKRRLTITNREDLIRLFNYDYPLITEFGSDLQSQFEKVELGPILFQYFPSELLQKDSALPKIPIIFAGWRGFASIRSYVGTFERCHMLRVCGEDPQDQLEAARKEHENSDENQDEMQ